MGRPHKPERIDKGGARRRNGPDRAFLPEIADWHTGRVLSHLN